MSTANQFLNLPVRFLHQNEGKFSSVAEIQREHEYPIVVVDLWHTKCTKCPATLSKLNDEAEGVDRSELLYIAVALSLGEENYDIARDVSERQWDNLLNIFMDVEAKDQAKAILGYSQVPFYIVVGKDGNIVGYGDSKSTDVKSLVMKAKTENNSLNSANTSNAISFDEDF